MSGHCGGILAAYCVIIAGVGGFFTGHNRCRDNFRDELIKRGIAEWRDVPQTNGRRFTYILGDEPKAEAD